MPINTQLQEIKEKLRKVDGNSYKPPVRVTRIAPIKSDQSESEIFQTTFLDECDEPELVLRAKYEKIFYQFFDVNRNQVIDWNDFETLSERIKDLRGVESQEYRIVSGALRVIWRGLVEEVKGRHVSENADEEAELSVEEWVELWKKRNPGKGKLRPWQWDYVKNTFFLIDTSGDKNIHKGEYIEAMRLYGMSAAEAGQAFDRFAFDKDGKPTDSIDYGEFVKLWIEFFSSGDKKAPGNFLFGL